MTADIQPVAQGDIPALLPLVEQYWIFEDIDGFDAGRVGRELERVCADPRLGSAWIARTRDRAVGYLLAVYVFSLEHLGLTAEIDEFFVLPSARGKGIGDGLLRLAEAEFGRRGCTNVALQLGKGNEAARVFYRAHGYGERAGFELLDKMLASRMPGEG
jgi:GNAT superfamily N-acetyltransferase